MRKTLYYYAGALAGILVGSSLALWWYAHVNKVAIRDLLGRTFEAPSEDGSKQD